MGGEESSLTEEQTDIQSDKPHSEDWLITADLCALLIKKEATARQKGFESPTNKA